MRRLGKWTKLVCMGCGKDFERVNAHIRRTKGKFQYCTKECSYRDPVLRRCKDCGEVKPTSEFERQGISRLTGRQYYRPRCKQCDAPFKKVWQERRRSASGLVRSTFTKEQWIATLDAFEYQCGYCSRPLERKNIDQDHFIPLSAGGPYEIGNIVPSCRKCNSSKNATHPREWLSPRDFAKVSSILKTLCESSLINGENLNAKAHGNPQQAGASRAVATTE